MFYAAIIVYPLEDFRDIVTEAFAIYRHSDYTLIDVRQGGQGGVLMKMIENQTFDMERALYGSKEIFVKDCAFDGPADGESAFKECEDVQVEHSFFNLRYPFWHDHRLKIQNSEMTSLCRAALWYSDHIEITDTKLHGIKALRECSNVKMKGNLDRLRSGGLTMEKHAQEYKKIGLNIAYYRKLKGLSQIQLAEAVGISRTHISNIEAPNMPTSISLETLMDIADVLEIPAASLLIFKP